MTEQKKYVGIIRENVLDEAIGDGTGTIGKDDMVAQINSNVAEAGGQGYSIHIAIDQINQVITNLKNVPQNDKIILALGKLQGAIIKLQD